MAKKPYDVVVFEEYTNSSGEVKNKGYQVGVAFEIDSGGMSVQLPDGISLSGRFSILPRREKAEG